MPVDRPRQGQEGPRVARVAERRPGVDGLQRPDPGRLPFDGEAGIDEEGQAGGGQRLGELRGQLMDDQQQRQHRWTRGYASAVR